MPYDEEREPEIKVVDRRRFIQEGDEVRENPNVAPTPPSKPEPAAAAAEPPPEPPAAPPPPAETVGTKTATESAGGPPPPEEESAQQRAQRRADQAAAGLPPAEFSTLVEFLAQQVLLYLGEPDPMGRAIQPNQPLAAMFIDLLGVLQEKTQGRLTLEESQALDQLLYSLRLQYVQKKK